MSLLVDSRSEDEWLLDFAGLAARSESLADVQEPPIAALETACERLIRLGASFRVSGFGETDWPVGDWELCAYVKQIPQVMLELEARQGTRIGFLEQQMFWRTIDIEVDTEPPQKTLRLVAMDQMWENPRRAEIPLKVFVTMHARFIRAFLFGVRLVSPADLDALAAFTRCVWRPTNPKRQP